MLLENFLILITLYKNNPLSYKSFTIQFHFTRLTLVTIYAPNQIHVSPQYADKSASKRMAKWQENMKNWYFLLITMKCQNSWKKIKNSWKTQGSVCICHKYIKTKLRFALMMSTLATIRGFRGKRSDVHLQDLMDIDFSVIPWPTVI